MASSGEGRRVSKRSERGGGSGRAEDARGAVEGRVTTAGGEPVGGAAVSVSEGPPHPDVAARTDAEGRFALANLEPGEYRITASQTGHAPTTVRVAVQAGRVAEVTFRLGE
jgi:protocatechuate 3,4-dioxygenase beta subunit